jgi:hypothetical protein
MTVALTPEDLAAGVPYAIGRVLVDALRNASELEGVVVIDNPVRNATLGDDGPRVVFYEDAVDRAKEGSSSVLRGRTYSFNICTINRSQQARRGAHRDHRAAVDLVRTALAALAPVAFVQSKLREGDTTYRLENVDVGGALVLTSFSVDYRDPA